MYNISEYLNERRKCSWKQSVLFNYAKEKEAVGNHDQRYKNGIKLFFLIIFKCVTCYIDLIDQKKKKKKKGAWITCRTKEEFKLSQVLVSFICNRHLSSSNWLENVFISFTKLGINIIKQQCKSITAKCGDLQRNMNYISYIQVDTSEQKF